MVHFQTTASWTTIKNFKSPYFAWLWSYRVYLNLTKFKTKTFAFGFLVGARPGFLQRNEAEEAFRGSLGLDKGELDFQLSSRYISVPLKEWGKERFRFPRRCGEDIIQRCFTTSWSERFHKLKHPSVAMIDYPYTGNYQFVPLLQSKEWSIKKSTT